MEEPAECSVEKYRLALFCVEYNSIDYSVCVVVLPSKARIF